MALETLLVHDEAGVRTVTLNRPGELNAVDERVTAELQGVLKDVRRDRGVRCLVLTGAGRAFCAGQDLKSVQGRGGGGDAGRKDLSVGSGGLDSKHPPQPPLGRGGEGADFDFTAALRSRYNPVILGLRSLEVPVIAMVNGVAAGAGWSLALACDLRIASKAAKFVGAFSKIGLVPDSGMTYMLPRLVGPAKALEIAWLGDPISAETALEWGLVNRVVEPEGLAAATREWAERLAKGPTKGLGLTKRAINASLGNDLAGQLEYEAQLQGVAGRTKDYAEGVKAFIEKREAGFVGE